jgi:hypothetical protein
MTDKRPGISFQLNNEQAAALKVIGGERTVRLAGRVSGSEVHVDFVACNSPFMACNAAFAACNSAFAKK